GRALRAPLAPAEHARVAELAEAPALVQLRAHGVVDVRVVTVDERQRGRYAPIGVEGVVHRCEPVAVDGAHFVVVLADLADADLAVAGHRLVLVDVLEAQIEAHAGLGPDALRVPAGIHHAEGAAARGARAA